MSENKFSNLKQTIHLFGLFLVSVTGFFGFTYIWEGVLAVSITMTLALVIITYVLVERLVHYKKAERKKLMNGNEIIALVIYSLVAIILSTGVFHSVNIDLIQKEHIQADGMKRIHLFGKMQEEYKKYTQNMCDNYKSRLKTAVDQYKNGNKEGFRKAGLKEGGNLDDQIDENVESLKTVLSKDIEVMDESTKEVIEDAKSVIDDWRRLSLPLVFNRIEAKLGENLKEYEGLSSIDVKSRPLVDSGKFEFKLPKSETIDLADVASEVDLKSAGFWKSFLLVIISQIMILAPYLFGDRGRRRIYTPRTEIRGIEI